jgi:hypothetical protein
MPRFPSHTRILRSFPPARLQGRASVPSPSRSPFAGSGPVEGFVLDLEEVWRCYE